MQDLVDTCTDTCPRSRPAAAAVEAVLAELRSRPDTYGVARHHSAELLPIERCAEDCAVWQTSLTVHVVCRLLTAREGPLA